MRLPVEARRLIREAVERGVKISSVAEIFGVTRKTVYKWAKRKNLNDRKRKPRKSKITLEVEYTILAIRNFFKWGTGRIQQGLISLPSYILESIEGLVQGVKLSRTAINNVLTKHRLNGYQNKTKTWKFFRATKPNELWQLGLKGPFTLQGRKYWYIVCVDDYSRYLLLNTCLDHVPDTDELFRLLEPLIKQHKPTNILTDNGGQFKEHWKLLCKEQGVKPLLAHPYYPQDKGKVERAIQNVMHEFIELLRKFPDWLDKLGGYTCWYNDQRFHRGVQCTPCELYT